MGMYCCCGQRKTDDWVCKCSWDVWYGCFKTKEMPENIIIKLPDKDGIYEVRVFDDGDNYEDASEFCLIKKHWGEDTNCAISNWKIEYYDPWSGHRGVYAWRRFLLD